MSYQASEEDALAVLLTAREHLIENGLFLFDFWHGPGVLTDPPTFRRKIIEDYGTRLERVAPPVLRVNDDIVEVHYAIELISKENGSKKHLEECHVMRYWFLPELRYLAVKLVLKLLLKANGCPRKIPGQASGMLGC